ncbi:hypothetical protein L210DRAFT_3508232 [Boletus edulis BED1]|uniref:Uncharacterized protein n=1 Tax=Boletus edulis BED1 TaxID=1328754 RepID=A0AAD4BI02_BOLED|nr:hypothetical protein L210DRAFT_3508232 [Boletus edulis BED1]
MEMEEVQHQIVVVASVDLAHIVLQSVDYIHGALPRPKLVKADVIDLIHFHVELDGFPPALVFLPAAPAPIPFVAPTLVDVVLPIEAPKVSAAPTLADVFAAPTLADVFAAPTLVDVMLAIEAPIDSAALTLADNMLAAAAPRVFVVATPVVFDVLFVDIAPVVVIPTVFYALCPHWQDQLEQQKYDDWTFYYADVVGVVQQMPDSPWGVVDLECNVVGQAKQQAANFQAVEVVQQMPDSPWGVGQAKQQAATLEMQQVDQNKAMVQQEVVVFNQMVWYTWVLIHRQDLVERQLVVVAGGVRMVNPFDVAHAQLGEQLVVLIVVM